ncbi:uncharacterized protein N7515_010209 [Penicillium bovifimosum]|uniref:Uncharacterized protein n=1 Tax=Penicillium bovifimosum TaxID=126998 RepID=A0A9W9GIH7_9EURO|nr:uncharacterized protein N7515_010209 [Penicillium bovifimosum]KAJ5120821.1 hypothetical protein N7515_010209 [Penicillium bovifimosum]
MIGLLLACFGVLKTTDYPTEQSISPYSERTGPEPSMVYPRTQSDLVICKAPGAQRQSVTGFNRDRVLTLGNNYGLPHKPADGVPKGKVEKVLSIHYKENRLDRANLLVEVLSGGKVTTGWFSYENIRNHAGTREAVATFRPQWI